MSAEAVPAVASGLARDRALHALALAAEGHDDEAVCEADVAVSLAPSAAGVHAARSAVLREAGRTGDALRAAEIAVQLAPDDPRAHRVHAAALAGVGQVGAALAAARRAAELAPEDPAVLRRLGDLTIDVDPAEAERHYRRGVRSDPRSAASHAGLARALRRLGRSEESEAEYERAAAADPAVLELRRRARALFSAILQAAVGTFLAFLAVGWIPDIVTADRPDARGEVAVLVALLATLGPLALLGWTAARVRRLGREAPVPPDVREDLRDLAPLVGAPASRA